MGRSGSTILELLLARMTGWVAGGELRRYWLGASLPGWICGCRRPVEECEFWRRVQRDLGGNGVGPDSSERLLSLQRSHLRLRPVSMARLLVGAPRSRDPSSALHEYQHAMASLYGAVARTAEARVVVDSSKQPQDAYLTTWNPDVEMFAIHLIRDPRAVAHSFSKRVPEPQPDLEYMPRSGPFGTAVRWSVRHGYVESLLKRRLGPRYLRLRYEDIMLDPWQAVRTVAAFVEQAEPPEDAMNGTRIDVSSNHTISGNPLRLQSHPIAIRSDDAWAARMSRRDQALATIAAAPLMRRYGYTRVPR
jgi:hypothetical protein